ncbi:hypothetical protein [Allosphingosinicella sp.]|uniref:hypothetical protein n=1 Tax=Allosphingosinicella sp. TaxID=2823234 RepID=UPI002FC0ECCA
MHVTIVAIALLMILIGGPLILGLIGWMTTRQAAPASAGRWNWPLTINSALIYTLAFNLVFFTQELFLVVPKALTPGLRPTLYHNNHGWEGDHPLASLFQGTGALAIFITGVLFALLLRYRPGRSVPAQLLLIWMTYHGLLQSLPQVAAGAISEGNDVGMAMDYLGMSAAAKTIAALVALAAIPFIALALGRSLLGLAAEQAAVASAGDRTRFIFRVAAVPGLIAIPLIIAFRVPRELLEVVLPPVLVTIIGIAWMQAGAWRIRNAKAIGAPAPGSIRTSLIAVLTLLLIFQIVLRPGIPFF